MGTDPKLAVLRQLLEDAEARVLQATGRLAGAQVGLERAEAERYALRLAFDRLQRPPVSQKAVQIGHG